MGNVRTGRSDAIDCRFEWDSETEPCIMREQQLLRKQEAERVQSTGRADVPRSNH